MYEIAVVVCETNPFHNGHAALFQRAREEIGENGVLVAVMSGNFVQRGMPAVWEKYRRAAMLVRMGVDLVVELPYPWSAAGGENFARAGVSIARDLGAKRMVFGSEMGDTAALCTIAARLRTREMDEKRAEYQREKPEYGAAAIEDILCAGLGIAPLSANDKLGLWYIAALQDVDCQPVAVPRLPSSNNVTSASRIREWLYAGDLAQVYDFVPESIWQAVQSESVTHLSTYFDHLHTYFRFFASDVVPELREAAGGVYERLRKSAYQTASGSAFFKIAACKKYTNARLRRAALFCATGVTDRILSEPPRYTLLLAANHKGCSWLGKQKKNTGLSILTKPANFFRLSNTAQAQIAHLHRADDLYAYLMDRDRGYFLRTSPSIERV